MQFEIYKNNHNSSTDDWSWQLKQNNNKVLAHSSDRFLTKEACEANIHILMSIDRSIPIISMSDKEPNLMSVFLESLFAKTKKN